MSHYGIFRKISGGGMGVVYEGEGRLSEREKMFGWFKAEAVRASRRKLLHRVRVSRWPFYQELQDDMAQPKSTRR
jgi:hypothetical protein